MCVQPLYANQPVGTLPSQKALLLAREIHLYFVGVNTLMVFLVIFSHYAKRSTKNIYLLQLLALEGRAWHERLISRLPVQKVFQHFCIRFVISPMLLLRYLFHWNSTTANIRGVTNSRLKRKLLSSLLNFQEASSLFMLCLIAEKFKGLSHLPTCNDL